MNNRAVGDRSFLHYLSESSSIDRQTAFFYAYCYGLAVLNLAAEEQMSEWVLDVFLDHSFERTGSICWIITFFSEPGFGCAI